MKAEEFAYQVHLGHMYGDVPYFTHLVATVEVLKDFNYIGQWIDAGFLHDVREMTDVSFDYLECTFGDWVASIVEACTGVGETRKARNQCIYSRIQKNTSAATVKTADRITHIEAGIPGSKNIKMYLKERFEFDENVAILAHPAMRDRLNKAYERFLIN